MAEVLLAEIQPANAATAAPVMVRVAGGGVRAYNGHRGQTDWRSAVIEPIRYATKIGFDETGWTGGATTTGAAIVLGSADRAFREALASYYWKGAPVTVWRGDDALDAPVWTVELQGKVADAGFQGGQLQLTVSDLSGKLSALVAADTFAGTGGIEGGTDAVGRVKRRSWGRVFNIEGRLLDKAYNIYEFGHPYYPWHSFRDLRDKGGSASQFNIVPFQGTVDATLAALRAAVVPGGGGVVAPSIACGRWWTQPTGPLTADGWGETNSIGFIDKAAQIAARVADLFGPLPISNTVAATAMRPGIGGIHCDDASETAAMVLDRLLLGVSLTWVPDPNGVITILPFEWTAPVATLRSTQVARKQVLPPAGTRTVGYLRNHRVQSDAEIRADVLAGVDGIGDLALLDAVDFNTQVTGDGKPEAGATVGAPAGTMVGNKAAELVAQAIDDFEQIENDVQGLIATYGQTQAAATSAEAARLSALDSKGFADVSTENAQAAARSSSLATRGTSFTQNPNFSDWPVGQFLPTGWGGWADWQTVLSRTTGVDGYPNAVRLVLAANQDGGVIQTVNRPFGSYVIELTIRASNVAGAGIFVQPLKADDGQFDGGSANKFLSLLNKQDTSKWPGQPDGDSGGYLRTFSWYFETPVNGDIAKINLYGMGNWENLAGPRTAKTFDVHAFRVRAATEAEIAQHDPIDGLASKASHDEVVSVAVDKAGNALTTARDEYSARFSGVVATGLSNLIGQRPTYTEVSSSVSTAIVTAAGPNGAVAQRIFQTLAATGGNLVPNTGLVTTASWGLANDGQVGGLDYVGLNAAGDDWHPFGENALSLHQVGGDPNQEFHWYTDPISVEQGQLYQGSSLLASHRCDHEIHIEHLNEQYQEVAARSYSGRIAMGGGGNGGRNVNAWNGPHVNFVAQGTYVRLSLKKYGTNPGQGDSYWWAVRPQVIRIPDLSVGRLPFQPGSDRAVTRITQASLADFSGKLASYITLAADAGSNTASINIIATQSYTRLIFRANQFLFEGQAIFDRSILVGKMLRDDMIRGGYDQDYPEWRNSGLGVSNLHPYFGIYIGDCNCDGPSKLTVVVNRSRVRGIQTSPTAGGMEYDGGGVKIRVGYPGGYVERSISNYDDRVMTFFIPGGRGVGTVYVQVAAYNGATDFVTYEGAAGYVQHRSVDWAISELDVEASWSFV